MYNSTLFQLIKTLSDKEFKQLGLFMRAHLHNNSQMCLKLFSIIEKAYPHLDAPILAKEVINKKIFPKVDNYDSSSLRNLMTQLKELVEEFLPASRTWPTRRRALPKIFIVTSLF